MAHVPVEILPPNFCVFGNEPVADWARDHWSKLLLEYEGSGLSSPNLRVDIQSRNLPAFWGFLWEAMLFRHFSRLTSKFRHDHVAASGQGGPDLGLQLGEHAIWIEAAMPQPSGLPDEWINRWESREVIAQNVPHEAILLRWTGKLKEKNDQLKRRIESGVVTVDEAYVVAINSYLLSRFPGDDYGISQLPYAAEATFPLGGIGIPITKSGKPDGEPRIMLRWSIPKSNGIDIPTANFLNPEYAQISALVGCCRAHMQDENLHLIVVHNPLAKNPIQQGILGAAREYAAVLDDGGEYLFQRVR